MRIDLMSTGLREREAMDRKITVVGAGNVGATAAQRLAEKAWETWC